MMTTYTEDRPTRLARAWLARHAAADRAPTPLLVARLATRRRGELIGSAAAGTIMIGYLGWQVAHRLTIGEPVMGPDARPANLALLTAILALLIAGTIGAGWYQRRADRRTGQQLRQRVARSAAPSMRQLVGGWFTATATVIYGGGLLVGLAAAGFAPSSTDRLIGAIFAGGVLVYAAAGAVTLADVRSRPAVASDAATLVDDELLRREDAHRALTPFPPLLALIAGLDSSSGDPLLLTYLGYAAAALFMWGVAVPLANHTNAARVATHLSWPQS